jgi:hypothetical protein
MGRPCDPLAIVGQAMKLRASIKRINRVLPPLLRLHNVPVPNPEHREIFERRVVLGHWLQSFAAARRGTYPFHEVSLYCFFLGSPRSGHSLLGSLLDAHPMIVIAHELDALPLVDAGYSREQLFWSILDNSRRFAESGRGWAGYSYAVPNQWQGRFDSLHVVGDKKGGASTLYLAEVNPAAVDALRRRVGVPIRVILYHRNPFDVLGTVAHRGNRAEITMELARAMVRRFETIDRARNALAANERLDIYHERFLRSPRDHLARAVHFLGEEASGEYLDDATSIVNESATRSRDKVSWPPDVIRYLERELSRSRLLAHYSYAR